METFEKKLKFIELRANNYSYDRIAKELHISKRTCINWNKELSNEINTEKNKYIDESKAQYSLMRESRVKRLTDVLEKIDKELLEKDFSTVSTENLLKFKLRYETELAKENVSSCSIKKIQEGTVDEIKSLISSIYQELQEGSLSENQVKIQLETLKTMLQALKQDNLNW